MAGTRDSIWEGWAFFQKVQDCKDHKEKVGIKKVEEFHGQMDDVGAPVGIMVSPQGFDEGARARAPQLNIYLVNAPWDLMALAKGLGSPPEFYECSECGAAREERDRFDGFVHWDYPESVHDVTWGVCDWCNIPHAICPDCGEVTGFCESDLGVWIECSGGCDRLYRVMEDLREAEREHETLSGLQRELVVEAHAKGMLTMDKVDAIISRSKWQYARGRSHNPVLELDWAGWVAVTEDGLLATEKTAEFVEKQLPRAKESDYGW